MISSKQRKELLKFIKLRYTVGTYVFDSTRSQPYKIKKQSVFHVTEWDYLDVPEKDEDIYVDFLVRDRGKYSEFYNITCCPKRWCKI